MILKMFHIGVRILVNRILIKYKVRKIYNTLFNYLGIGRVK